MLHPVKNTTIPPTKTGTYMVRESEYFRGLMLYMCNMHFRKK